VVVPELGSPRIHVGLTPRRSLGPRRREWVDLNLPIALRSRLRMLLLGRRGSRCRSGLGRQSQILLFAAFFFLLHAHAGWISHLNLSWYVTVDSVHDMTLRGPLAIHLVPLPVSGLHCAPVSPAMQGRASPGAFARLGRSFAAAPVGRITCLTPTNPSLLRYPGYC